MNANQVYLIVITSISLILGILFSFVDPILASIFISSFITIICFYFLQSVQNNAKIRISTAELGGAVAGFAILFLIFYNTFTSYSTIQVYLNDEQISGLEQLLVHHIDGKTGSLELRVVRSSLVINNEWCTNPLISALCRKEKYQVQITTPERFKERNLQIELSKNFSTQKKREKLFILEESITDTEDEHPNFHVGFLESNELEVAGFPDLNDNMTVSRSLDKLAKNSDGFNHSTLTEIREGCTIKPHKFFCTFPTQEIKLQGVAGQEKGTASICPGNSYFPRFGNATLELTLKKPEGSNMENFQDTQNVRLNSYITTLINSAPCGGENTNKLIRINADQFKNINDGNPPGRDPVTGYARINIQFGIGQSQLPQLPPESQ